MVEHLRSTEEDRAKFSLNPVRLLMQGWQMVKRHDQLNQIGYVDLRLRRDHSNCDGVLEKVGDYAIYAHDGEGEFRSTVAYVRSDDLGKATERRVTIMSGQGAVRLNSPEHIMVDDTPLEGEKFVTRREYYASEGLRSPTNFPFAELERELTEIYKDAKPHLWPEDPFWL